MAFRGKLWIVSDVQLFSFRPHSTDHGEEVGTDNKHHEGDIQRDSAVIGGAVILPQSALLCRS